MELLTVDPRPDQQNQENGANPADDSKRENEGRAGPMSRLLARALFDVEDPAAVRVLASRNQAGQGLGGTPSVSLGSGSPVCASPVRRPSQSSALHDEQRLRDNLTASPSRLRPDSALRRHIHTSAERVLDAPQMVDDFYVNVVDWSRSDCLAVGLGSYAYLWNARTNDTTQLTQIKEEAQWVTAVRWANDSGRATAGAGSGSGSGSGSDASPLLGLGGSDGRVQVWDCDRQRQLGTWRLHGERSSVLAWLGPVVSSGSRDASIVMLDTRQREVTAQITGHTDEVCGLRWSPDGRYLASGSNDNRAMVWDARKFGSASGACEPLYVLAEAKAAIKALVWLNAYVLVSVARLACGHFVTHDYSCFDILSTQAWHPDRPLLVTGGGTSDPRLRFYDSGRGRLLHEFNTESQISSIVWSPDAKELITSHGYPDWRLSVWQFNTGPAHMQTTLTRAPGTGSGTGSGNGSQISLRHLATLKGHTQRVLHTAVSPDGSTVCSAAADESLRFWRVWDPRPPVNKSVRDCPLLTFGLGSTSPRPIGPGARSAGSPSKGAGSPNKLNTGAALGAVGAVRPGARKALFTGIR